VSGFGDARELGFSAQSDLLFQKALPGVDEAVDNAIFDIDDF